MDVVKIELNVEVHLNEEPNNGGSWGQDTGNEGNGDDFWVFNGGNGDEDGDKFSDQDDSSDDDDWSW